MGMASVETPSPARRAALMASIPSYAKHLTSMSDRILTAFGVRRREMFSVRVWRSWASRLSGEKTFSDSLGGRVD